MNSSNDPKVIAGHGEDIYQAKYKVEYEAKHPGKFVAIDIVTEKSYIADSPTEALELARKDSPKGLFHLIKVGSLGAFKVSYTSRATTDWLFR